MTSPFDGYEVEPQLRPRAARYDFDLDAALDAVVVLEARVPPDAITAASLGTDRLGNGIVLGTEGLVLTIGYLLMEAERVTRTGDQPVSGLAVGSAERAHLMALELVRLGTLTDQAARFLEDSRTMGRVPWMKEFRRYVRDELAAPPPGPRNGADQP